MLTEKNEMLLREKEITDSLKGADGNNPTKEDIEAVLELALIVVMKALIEVFEDEE